MNTDSNRYIELKEVRVDANRKTTRQSLFNFRSTMLPVLKKYGETA
jgi:hypothetical protein